MLSAPRAPERVYIQSCTCCTRDPTSPLQYNSSLYKVIKIILFEANLRYTLKTYYELRTRTSNTYYIQVDAGLIKYIIRQCSLNIQFYTKRNAYYYNKQRLEGPYLKRGDKVYLLQRNIKTTRLLDKLNQKKIRLFKITKVIEKVNYRIKLLKYIYINPVFYILLLELAKSNILTIILELLNKNETIKYEV